MIGCTANPTNETTETNQIENTTTNADGTIDENDESLTESATESNNDVNDTKPEQTLGITNEQSTEKTNDSTTELSTEECSSEPTIEETTKAEIITDEETKAEEVTEEPTTESVVIEPDDVPMDDLTTDVSTEPNTELTTEPETEKLRDTPTETPTEATTETMEEKTAEESTEAETKPIINFTNVNETVWATADVNIRKGPGTEYGILGQISGKQSVTRIGVGDNGWSKVLYNDQEAYISSNYLTTSEPAKEPVMSYPFTYSDDTCSITIYKEWFEHAWVYAAHIQFSDYSRMYTDCGNGTYGGGFETTSHAAQRNGAIFAVNGCYSAPYLDYTVVRHGVICNGANRGMCLPAVYSTYTGLLQSAWETGGVDGIKYVNTTQLVNDGLVTDTFCFGPPGMTNGVITDTTTTGARAQRTFIGTNGNAGDIWVCVSDGRYNDGESAGLLGNQCMRYLQSKGCTFGVNLDGGGSTAMYFNGQVLNAVRGNERAVVDFLLFK